MGTAQTKEATVSQAASGSRRRKVSGAKMPAENAAKPSLGALRKEGEKLLWALLNGSARVKVDGAEFVVERRGSEDVPVAELTQTLRVAKIDDRELLDAFFSSPRMSLKGLTKEADTMAERTPELSKGLYEGTNVLQKVSQEELEAVSHYTTELYKGINSLLRGDLSGYLDRAGDWLMAGKSACDDRTLNVVVAHAIVVASTLNKLPDFTSAHNVSSSNPNGYMSRGMEHCPKDVMKQLNAASTGKVLFSDNGFLSASWNGVPRCFSPEYGKGVLLKIISKTGSHIFHASAFAPEREILFAPGVEFKVTKGKRDKKTGAAVFMLQEVG